MLEELRVRLDVELPGFGRDVLRSSWSRVEKGQGAIGDQARVIDDRDESNAEWHVGHEAFKKRGVKDAHDQDPFREQAHQTEQTAIRCDRQTVNGSGLKTT